MDPGIRPEPQGIPEKSGRVVLIAIIAALAGALVAGVGVYLVQRSHIQSLESQVNVAQVASQTAATKVSGLEAQVEKLTAAVTHQEKKARQEAKLAKEAKKQAKDAKQAEQSSADLADGKWYGSLKSVSESPDEIGVDVEQYFSGSEADAAAKQDGAESPVPNDVYIRNESKLVRTFPVASDVTVKILQEGGSSSKTTTVSFKDFANKFNNPTKDDKHLKYNGYWFWLSGGEVVKIEEQFHP